jgi:hypothetical protein
MKVINRLRVIIEEDGGIDLEKYGVTIPCLSSKFLEHLVPQTSFGPREDRSTRTVRHVEKSSDVSVENLRCCNR